MAWLCGLGAFSFPSVELDAWHTSVPQFPDASGVMSVEIIFPPSFVFSVSGPLLQYLDLPVAVYLPPIFCLLVLFALICFCFEISSTAFSNSNTGFTSALPCSVSEGSCSPNAPPPFETSILQLWPEPTAIPLKFLPVPGLASVPSPCNGVVIAGSGVGGA